MGINKVIFIGRVGKEPTIKEVGQNKVAEFSLASTETWKDKNGEKQQSTEWINCVAWKGLANVIESYVKKGNQVYIEGKLKTDSYEKDGQKRYSTKVVVSSLEMLGGKSEPSNNSQISKGSDNVQSEEETDDLPF